jgi:hypothetical protein
MAKKDKREQIFRDNTRNVPLADFEWLVNQYGYVKMGGSHALAVIGTRIYPYPRSNPLPHQYVSGLLKIIDNEEK